MNTDFEGNWRPVRAELDGEVAPGMALEKMELVLRAGNYAVTFGGQTADEGSYTFEISAEHVMLTLRGTHGTNAGRDIPAIGQIRGDRLRVCYGLDGVRPTTFATNVGTRRYLVTYRRLAAP